MPTFGITTGGGSTFPTTNDRAILSKFTAPGTGIVTQINQRWHSSSTGTDSFKGLIYAADGAGGIPGTRLGIGSIASVPAGGGDVASTGLSVAITGGVDYWIGSVIDAFSGVWECDAAGVGLSRMEGTTYASPAATWTESGTGSATVNVYATYVSGPTITVQPTNQRGIAAGGTASFSITATGGTLSYQWKDNSSGTFTNVGTNSASYTTGTLAAGDSYAVVCEVTDSNGTTVSNYVSVWVSTKYNPAWQGLYSRSGRSFSLGQATIPTSKAVGNIFDNALFDEVIISGGTTYNQSVAGSITASAILSKLTSKFPLGSITVTGTISRQTLKRVSGSSTVTGSISKQTNKTFIGTSTITGNIAKQTNKTFIGSIVSSSILTAQILFIKAIAGSITATGSLVMNSAFVRALSGSITASGIVTKSTLKTLTGSITTAGSLIKQTLKRFTGTIALSGALITAFSTLKTVVGSITISGIVSGLKFTPTINTVFSASMRSLRRFIGRR